MEKPAETTYPVAAIIRQRWSPRAFGERAITGEQLGSLLEAARWAPSCFNDQPWRFIVAPRDDEAEFGRMLGCLTEKNQRWARNAALLLLVCHAKTFQQGGRPNRWAAHDTGLAAMSLALQAESMGLRVHFMAGIDRSAIRETYGVPEDHEPLTAIAVGWPGDPGSLAEEFREAELGPRSRRALAESVFTGGWGRPAGL